MIHLESFQIFDLQQVELKGPQGPACSMSNWVYLPQGSGLNIKKIFELPPPRYTVYIGIPTFGENFDMYGEMYTSKYFNPLFLPQLGYIKNLCLRGFP